jgi:AcrR family transcriptional regulator
VNQDRKSEKSRAAILGAALQLFSHQGYRGTSLRDIAAKAGVSTGNVYHHFADKETIFETLLSQYWAAIERPDFPFNRALASGTFPENLEELAAAAEESVRRYRPYVALIYVDVVELSGDHIRKFYSEMSERFASFIKTRVGEEALAERLRPGVTSLSAVMLASRIFLHYFAVEILFGVPNQFGKDSRLAVSDIADILRHGLLRPAAAQESNPATAPAAVRSA